MIAFNRPDVHTCINLHSFSKHLLLNLCDYVLFCMQAIRVLGLLGALDPYKHKLNQTGGVLVDGDSAAISKDMTDSEAGNTDNLLSQETFFQSGQSYGNQTFNQVLPEILFACLMFFLILFPLIFTADTNTSEMLVTMGSIQLEEFYPAVAVSALMRIVRDSSLSSHHTMVIQVCLLLCMMLSGKAAIFY